MNTEEKLKSITDLIKNVAKANAEIKTVHKGTSFETEVKVSKFGNDEFSINEDGSIREELFIKCHIAPTLLAHAIDLASDKE